MKIASENYQCGRKRFFNDVLLYVYIALPVFFWAWWLGFLSLDTPYEVSADIKADYDGAMNVQVYYVLKGLNHKFAENYSVREDLNLKKDQYSHFSVRLNRTNKTLKRLRLDLGDRACGRITIRNIRVGGHRTSSAGDEKEFESHDLRLVYNDTDSAVFDVTGPDPFIASKHTLISSARVWVTVLIATLLSCALFAAVRFIPAVSRVCGLTNNGRSEVRNKQAGYDAQPSAKVDSAADSTAGTFYDSDVSYSAEQEHTLEQHQCRRKKSFFHDVLTFLCIALPVFFFSWSLGFFSLDTPYEVSADIKSDYDGKMRVQVYYVLNGLNKKYSENYSVRHELSLQKDQYSRLSVRLNRTNKTLKRLRLDLGDRSGGRITIRNLRVGGHKILSEGDEKEFEFHDLIQVSSGPDGAVFDVKGSDPFIASKHTVISPVRVWMAVLLSLLLSSFIFAAVKLIPAVWSVCHLSCKAGPRNNDSMKQHDKTYSNLTLAPDGYQDNVHTDDGESGSKLAPPAANELNSTEQGKLGQAKGYFPDVLLFFYIALPVFLLAWTLGFFSLDTPYEVSADIKSDHNGAIGVQVYYVLKGLNSTYAENYSVKQELNLQRDEYSHFSVRLNRTNKTLKRLRLDLDLGDSASGRITIRNLRVGGYRTERLEDENEFEFHDLSLVSYDEDGAVFDVTGTDPFIASKHTVISPVRVWVAVFITLLIAGMQFAIVRFIPSLRKSFGLDLAKEKTPGIKPENNEDQTCSNETARVADGEHAETGLTTEQSNEKTAKITRKQGFFLDSLLFIYIALPIFLMAWALGLFALNTPYEVSADIKADYDGVIGTQVFYVLKGLNHEFADNYSIRQDLALRKNQFSHLSVRLKHTNKTLKQLRLNLGGSAAGRITVRNFRVGGRRTASLGNWKQFRRHNLRLISYDADSAEFEVTGADPYIATRHTVISPVIVWAAVFIVLLISGCLFSIVRFIPGVRRACGIDWEIEQDKDVARRAEEGNSSASMNNVPEDHKKHDSSTETKKKERTEMKMRRWLSDAILFVYIALPFFIVAWALNFYTLDTPYEVSADIKADYDGVMKAQVYYVLKGLNHGYADNYSVSRTLPLQKDQFSHLSVRLNRTNKTLKRLRLDLGDRAIGRITIRNLKVGGHRTASVGNVNEFDFHDLKLISDGVDGAVFEVTGADPFIASKHSIITPLRVWMALFITLFISGVLFSVVRFVPSVRRACGIKR